MKVEELKKETREQIYQHITKIKSAKDIFDLFRLLNYPKDVVFDISSKRRKTSFDFKKEDEQRIKEIYSILSFDEKLPIFLLETTSLAPSFIRSVTNTFDKQYLQFLLIFTMNYAEIVFVFPNREKIETGKHKLKLTKLIVDKEDIISKKEYYSVIETLANIRYENETIWRDIWKKWKKAFSVERVTEDFFEDYKSIFFTLRNDLHKQNVPRKESHEFTLQFLNRIMFIYFISKKKWLEQPRFIEWLWTSYKNLGKFGSNEFYEKWLKQIFLKAFNNRPDEIKSLPDDVVKVILSAPYLNGGLFRQNNLDALKIEITDRMFQRIFEFFEKYNFTIKEDMPLDQEVAVDPQMIGYVYESLAYVGDEIYDRNDLGIFYTPRVEVDFMCRRSLVEYLSKNLPEVPKEKFYHLIFDLPEEKEKIEKWFAKGNLWGKLEETLDNLSVVDPACGSGAFLVGMLNVVAEIYRIIYKHMNRRLTDFQLKNRIIQYSLYGVDVMPWAIHAAELRLWLQLIVETEFKKDELRKHPLLPNLNLNLRIGDSLVQEIGGISFNLKTNNLKLHLKNKLESLKQEKRKYFENSPNAKFKTPEEVKAEEIRLFEEIIDERVECLETDIKVYKNDIKKAKSQRTLTGEYNIDEKKVKENEVRIDLNEKEIEKLKKIKALLRDPEKKPFVWDIDFAEIFSEKNGFDIVIGNPPYVRQEMISPPNKIKAEVTLEERREYKEKLINSVKNIFPVIENIDKKSDYYIYFYFHGLGLLNEKGTFCFITSNSWLDVGYGKELQEFLCKYVPIIAIYDNPKRSFAHADVNTIIALFGAPKFEEEKTVHGLKIEGNNQNWPMLSHTAKFVMFKKPFEEVLSTKNLIEIEEAKANIKGQGITELVKNVLKTDDYRCFPIIQEDLLEDGWEYPEDYDEKKGRFQAGSYEGNKWGGKYLRAPDIFYTILEKGKGKLVRLTSIAKIEGYIHGFNVGSKFPKVHLIDSPSKAEIIFLDKNSPGVELIGVKHEGNSRQLADLLYPRMFGDRFFVLVNYDKIYGQKFYKIILQNKKIKDALGIFLNSTISMLQNEIYLYSTWGLGAISVNSDNIKQINVLKDFKFSNHAFLKFFKRPIKPIFAELGIDPNKPIREQEPKPLPDRAELDKIIFDELGLTEQERKEVYWSVCELVKQRIDKARSLRE